MFIGQKLTTSEIQSTSSTMCRKDYTLIPLFMYNYTLSPLISYNYTRSDIYTNIALEIIL